MRESRRQTLEFEDRMTPFFHDLSTGLIWISHTCWDAFSSAVLASRGLVTRHFSVQEDRVHQLHLEWKEGNEIVDQVLRGPALFDLRGPADP